MEISKEHFLEVVEEMNNIIKQIPVWQDFPRNPLFMKEVNYVYVKLREVEKKLENGIASESVSLIPLELVALAGILYRSMRSCQSLKLTDFMAQLAEIIVKT